MCVGDVSNTVGSAQIHAGLSKSMWRPRGGSGSRRRDNPPPPHPPTPPPSLLSVLRTGVWVRVRGLDSLGEAPRTGCNGTKWQKSTWKSANWVKSAKWIFFGVWVEFGTGVWDQSPCVWSCLCMPIEATLLTGVWDYGPKPQKPLVPNPG